LLDRIDIQLRVQRITAAQLRLAHEARGVSSAAARARVSVARAAAAERLVNTPWQLNSQVPGAWLRGPGVRLAPAVTASIDRALERGGITMRGYDRVLRLAWTIADLAGDTSPNAAQLGQALYLRRAMSN
jgi:magnesium chelatase family protein